MHKLEHELVPFATFTCPLSPLTPVLLLTLQYSRSEGEGVVALCEVSMVAEMC